MFNPKCQIHKLLGEKKNKLVGARFKKAKKKKNHKNKSFFMLSSNSIQLLAKGCECKMFTWTQGRLGKYLKEISVAGNQTDDSHQAHNNPLT